MIYQFIDRVFGLAPSDELVPETETVTTNQMNDLQIHVLDQYFTYNNRKYGEFVSIYVQKDIESKEAASYFTNIVKLALFVLEVVFYYTSWNKQSPSMHEAIITPPV